MIRVTGIKEIDAVLKALPVQMTDKVYQNANAKALEPLVERERATVPVGLTSSLHDSIGVVKASAGSLGSLAGLGANFASRELGVVTAGPRRRRPYKGQAGHLNEYGTVRRETARGANRGVMPAKPFAAPSWEATKNAVEVRIAQYLSVEVARIMRRTLK